MASKELSFTINVKVSSEGVEHDLLIDSVGLTAGTKKTVEDVINEDYNFLNEDMVRRVYPHVRSVS